MDSHDPYYLEAKRIREARDKAAAEGLELLTPLAARTLFREIVGGNPQGGSPWPRRRPFCALGDRPGRFAHQPGIGHRLLGSAQLRPAGRAARQRPQHRDALRP